MTEQSPPQGEPYQAPPSGEQPPQGPAYQVPVAQPAQAPVAPQPQSPAAQHPLSPVWSPDEPSWPQKAAFQRDPRYQQWDIARDIPRGVIPARSTSVKVVGGCLMGGILLFCLAGIGWCIMAFFHL